MKIIDRITEALGLYDEEEELFEEEAPKVKEEPKKAPLFSKKNTLSAFRKQEAEPEAVVQKEEPKKTSLFSKKTGNNGMAGRTIALPLADKQVKVVVLEPSGFDDSQKIADYLRNNQPVVVNFENTDSIVTKRMTDFVSGTIYALGGSMKKIGRSILVCAPKNVDIDAGISVYDEKGGQPWNK